jgi:transposase InsO family protein
MPVWRCLAGRWGVAGVVFQVAQARSVAASQVAGGVGGDDHLPVREAQGHLRVAADHHRPAGDGLASLAKHRAGAAARAGLGGSPQAPSARPDQTGQIWGKAPDALRRDSTPPGRMDVRWCGDLTEIPTDERKLQFAAVLDLHSRRCVGFAVGIRHDAQLGPRSAVCGHRGARRRP